MKQGYKIENVGFGYDGSKERGNGIFSMRGTIYGQENGEDTYNDFRFEYYQNRDIVFTNEDDFSKDFTHDELLIIKIILLNNLKTNFDINNIENRDHKTKKKVKHL